MSAAVELFEEGDEDHDGVLTCNEILMLMRKAGFSKQNLDYSSLSGSMCSSPL